MKGELIDMFFLFGKIQDMYISLAILPQNLTNMTKITYLQALIDSSMSTELKQKRVCLLKDCLVVV